MTRAHSAAGADVNQMDETGISALSAAVLANDIVMARTLIGLGAGVNAVDELSMTPLRHAALVDRGDTAMVDLLLQSGADRQIKSKDGLTAADLARRHHHEGILRALSQGRSAN